jgi:thymidylate synthase
MFIIVAARDDKNGIGYKGRIPWVSKTDMQFFKKLTMGHVVIMGRKTYESIGKPLPDRINVVMSKTELKEVDYNKETTKLVQVFNLHECLKYCNTIKDKTFFVIGGAEIYNLFLENKLITKAYISKISGNHKCDLMFDYNFEKATNYFDKAVSSLVVETESVKITKYEYENVEEKRYLNLLEKILKTGIASNDRTGTGTLRLFGEHLTFDLTKNQFPLCTSRKTFFRGIYEELMLYLRGQTNSKILEEKKINVWAGNTTRSFLDTRKLFNLPVGDMGHSYGFSFRHFGGIYDNCNTDYTKCRCGAKCKDGFGPDYFYHCPLNGFDQLEWLINEIKTNPDSRRLRLSLWEPNYMHKASLPPCLEQYQFSIINGGISCMMTQRSSDYFLAGNWNIATGALLTYLLASVCDLKPVSLIWNIGDVHVYNNLIDMSNELIKREPYMYPRLYVAKKNHITDYKFEDLELLCYQFHPSLTGKMSV